MTTEEITNQIKTSIVTDYVLVESLDQVHFYATIVSPEFESINKIKQHQLIMDLFKEEITQEVIHALSLKTYTPAKWQMLNNH